MPALPLHLMIPGPTPLPTEVCAAMSRPAIGHRSPEFKAILERVLPGLKWIFQTENDVMLLTASGTAAMEAAMINTLNPGDKVLVLVCGVFSERWAEMAGLLGADVTRITVPAGQPNTVEQLTEALSQQKYKAVVITHSETSTGILNPLKEMAKAIREHDEDILVLVDAITSMGAAELQSDDWDLDLVISGSQKSFMIPPGLSFVSVSQRAWQAYEQCQRPGLYFNLKKYKKAQDGFSTPYTPATHMIMALDVALGLMQEETLSGIICRHAKLQAMTRAGIRAMNGTCLVRDDKYASTAVTAVKPPEGIAIKDIRGQLKDRYGIVVANGQKELMDQIFRIGHLGYQFERDVLTVLAALEVVYADLGHQVIPGAAVAAAQQVRHLALDACKLVGTK